MAGLTVYTKERVSISVFKQGDNALILEGFAAGDFFTAERAQEKAVLTAGTHGEIEVSSMQIVHGTMALTLLGGSPANEVLQGFHDAFDLDATSLFTIIAVDTLAEETLAFCRDAIIPIEPPLTFGDARAPVEWNILCPHLTLKHSGGIRVS